MPPTEPAAVAAPGHEPQALSVVDAQARLARFVHPLAEREECPLPQALDRVLARDIVSPVDVPPHDNAAMDGFAFAGHRLCDGQPLVLHIAGSALAGQPGQSPLDGDAGCVRITTGAVMPEGLDTVVPQELVRVDGNWLHIPAGAVAAGAHRRRRGEDLRTGQPALRRGQRLGPAALGLLASLGLPTVPLVRRPRVACFSTGDEILSLGEAPREGALYDSNRYTVGGLLARLGVEVIDLGVVRDDPAALEAAFRHAASRADAIVTSGGVSVGEADHTKAVMRRVSDVAFWRIAMRPGRPLAVGRIETPLAPPPRRPLSSEETDLGVHAPAPHEALLFGLPGNPVAAMVTFLVFVRPALRRLMGCTGGEPLPVRVRSANALRKQPGRTEYQRGIVSAGPDGRLSVRSTGQQGSGVLRSMVEANALIVLHHDQGSVAEGDEVEVLLFDGLI